ncbi:hypothetical protein OQN31_23885 [Citrobacter freundii]|uniref:Uncharacterized protein n=1 Tax=Salmonella enterica TaxID=28901 RepID=A0A701SXB6_SALER|nr:MULTISPECIES: hypothetical protein [Enterobacteriaceae]EBV1452631.1 hypothetical protein [Salmonella enterica subsp. enterica serovar Hadar]ECV4537062.1 hypothetical protein [Salmonella enterica subsp. enterica serovar Oranienburg]ECZ7244163.1 M3 family oligoendopeptidase [Salmonella enterica]EDU9594641.1 M3 family oligoendopeptidase [Salmonella enterica subsp. enterica serovar Bareilly]HAC6480481.1 hypothetical protein [Salmonella enterica subsp. enterica serovar Newport]HCT2233473.1 hypo
MEENKSLEVEYNELKTKYNKLISDLERRNENITDIVQLITKSFFVFSFISFSMVLIQIALK